MLRFDDDAACFVQSAERLTAQALDLLEGYVQRCSGCEHAASKERAALLSENRRLKEEVARLRALVACEPQRLDARHARPQAPLASPGENHEAPSPLIPPRTSRLRVGNDAPGLPCVVQEFPPSKIAPEGLQETSTAIPREVWLYVFLSYLWA